VRPARRQRRWHGSTPDTELPAEVYDAYFANLDLLDALEREAA
jgi:hypothetical protein